MKSLTLVLLILISIDCKAQWPGAYYGFELRDGDGKIIDSLSKDYKLYIDSAGEGPISFGICEDNKLWRLYKGDKNLYATNFVVIEKLSHGDSPQKMLLKF